MGKNWTSDHDPGACFARSALLLSRGFGEVTIQRDGSTSTSEGCEFWHKCDRSGRERLEAMYIGPLSHEMVRSVGNECTQRLNYPGDTTYHEQDIARLLLVESQLSGYKGTET